MQIELDKPKIILQKHNNTCRILHCTGNLPTADSSLLTNQIEIGWSRALYVVALVPLENRGVRQ